MEYIRYIKFTFEQYARLYQSGLNDDPQQWPGVERERGTMGFSRVKDAHTHPMWSHVRTVIIPHGTEVLHHGQGTSTAASLILSVPRSVAKIWMTLPPERQVEMIRRYPDLSRRVRVDVTDCLVHMTCQDIRMLNGEYQYHGLPSGELMRQFAPQLLRTEHGVDIYEQGMTVRPVAGGYEIIYTSAFKFPCISYPIPGGTRAVCERFDGLAQGRSTLYSYNTEQTGELIDGLITGEFTLKVGNSVHRCVMMPNYSYRVI